MILLLSEATEGQTGLDLGRHLPKPPSKGSNSSDHLYFSGPSEMRYILINALHHDITLQKDQLKFWPGLP